MKTVCCMCHKIIKQQSVMTEQKSVNHLSHGYCRSCFQKTIRKITKTRIPVEQGANANL